MWRQRGAGARSLACSRPRSRYCWGRRVQVGRGSRAPMCSRLGGRGSHWSCRQPARVGGFAIASRPRGRLRSAGGRLTVPVAIGLDDGIVRAVWQAGSRVAAVSGRLPWTGFRCGLCRRSRSAATSCAATVPPAAGRAVVRRRPLWVGSRRIRSTCVLSSARLALEEDPDDDSDVLEHAGGSETRGGCWSGWERTSRSAVSRPRASIRR